MFVHVSVKRRQRKPSELYRLAVLIFLNDNIGARFLVHLVVEGRVRSFRTAKGARDVLIVGGGDGGRLVVRELIRNPQLRRRPVREPVTNTLPTRFAGTPRNVI